MRTIPIRWRAVATAALLALVTGSSATAASPLTTAAPPAPGQPVHAPSAGGAWNGIWGWDSTASGTTVLDAGAAIGVDSLQQYGLTGQGVGIALIDTGVNRVPGLDAGTVVDGPDLSFDSQDSTTRYRDGFGHGTHLAGIIAGNKPGFRGITSKAKLVSVKVGAANGAVDVVQVLAAIDWVVKHRNDDPANPIKVICLAYGTDSSQSYTSSPLAFAVENAWRAGISVVISGGNSGTSLGRLNAPAYDPYVIAVGASDIVGTEDSDDDLSPAFSSRGTTSRRVDFAAPGSSIVSLRDPGSYIDTNYPGARVGTDLFRGSGTSQAAAVVAGATALLYQQRPSLTPDQVKRLLINTSYYPNAVDVAAQGNGLVIPSEAYAAVMPTTTQTFTRSTGTGTLDSARGSNRVSIDGVSLTGEKDIFGAAFSTSNWAKASAAGTAWSGGSWMGTPLTGDGWVTVNGQTAWAGRAWSGRAWSGGSWLGRAWSSDAWLGKGWSLYQAK